ncbi:hypothetical protein QFC19_008480 [Naganishia cerealis]|uniref:Uncharacterized protein n=1 Tax=Naganishia cerealis TaxID=610337 RepID=A0ACC2V3D5_9TREE|nr:hypothetical protein QFC19_008480 [Naganishia cerealis]
MQHTPRSTVSHLQNMDSAPTYLAHIAARTYYHVRQLTTRSRGLFSTRTRQIGLFLACAFLLLLWVDPRLYHSLGPKDVLSLVPVPAPSSQLVKQLDGLNATLFEHYRSHGRSLPEGVFPYQALTRAQQTRYKLLSSDTGGLFLFTTLIRQVQDQIPDLLAALTVVIEALGPQRVAFSFLEGPSDDLTPTVFNDVLQPLLLSLGVPSQRIRIITDSPAIDFHNANRIEVLADLRNEALQPLWQEPYLGENVRAVVFFNDVYLKAEHVLEMLYMHQVNGAGMTAAWDWYKREPAYYYDIWVGRTVSFSLDDGLTSLFALANVRIQHLFQIDTGDLFYPIPNAWWSPSEDLFPDSPQTLAAFQALEPFQVFCGWNGMAVLDPKPFLPPYNIRFRRSDPSKAECAASECGLICSDYWREGFGRIQVVPSVQASPFGHAHTMLFQVAESYFHRLFPLSPI